MFTVDIRQKLEINNMLNVQEGIETFTSTVKFKTNNEIKVYYILCVQGIIIFYFLSSNHQKQRLSKILTMKFKTHIGWGAQ